MPTMKPLLKPSMDGDWEALRPFVNVTNDDFNLVIAWLLSSCADVPHFVLVISSEHGAGKSTLTRLLASILDPRDDDLPSPPVRSEDLYALAASRYLVTLNNVSLLSTEISDDLCRLSDGGSLLKRRLYSDNDVFNVSLRRPIVLNGISVSPDRPDLLDRSLVIETLPIANEVRQPEEKIFADFKKALPRILAALFNSISGAIREFSYAPKNLGRRADAESFIRRACKSGTMPFSEAVFTRIMLESDEGKVDELLSNSPVASKILEMKKTMYPFWQGRAAELVSIVNGGESRPISKYHPQTPKALNSQLKRLAPLLRQEGIVFENVKTNGGQRFIKINFDVPVSNDLSSLSGDSSPLSILDENGGGDA